MKKLLLLIVMLTVLHGKSQSLDTIKEFDYKLHYNLILKETKNKKSSYFYETQLKKFNNNEEQTDLEVLSMLIGYSDNPNFNPYFDISLDQIIYDLNEEGKFSEAIDYGVKTLNDKPFLIKFLREVAYAYKKMGDLESEKKNMSKTEKIYSAMFYSASGDASRAFFALGPKDGQYFIKYYIHSKIGAMGSGHDNNGCFIDMLDTTIDGKPVTLYFNIDHAMKTMRDKLGEK